MRTLSLLPLFTALFLLAACSDNPVSVDDHDDEGEELSVALTLSTEHVATLSEIDIDVAVMNHHGEPFVDFEMLRVEHRLVGSEDWREIEMHAEGNAFAGSYMFVTSGDYELRVTGIQHGHGELEVLHEQHDPLHVERTHVEAGDYRVEFESFPGHAHEGEEATVMFWVRHDGGAVSGLEVEIRCEDADGGMEGHDAQELEPGVYHEVHTFSGAGEAHVGIHFMTHDGPMVEADFHMPVGEGHHDG